MSFTRHARVALRIGWNSLWLAAACTACSGVGEVALGVCGNRVVETREDCDGQEGCNEACRYECGNDLSCPPGWGCDADAGICRAASGKFSTRELLGVSPYRPVVSDMDGDGRDDVLLVGSEVPSLAYYFGTDGSLQRSVTLPAAAAAAAADVTNDGLADQLLGSASLLGYKALRSRNFAALARSSRSVEPTSRLLAADLDCDRRRDLLLLEDTLLFRVSTSDELEPIGELDVSAGDIVADEEAGAERTIFARGTLPQGALSACEMFAVSELQGDAVYVYGAGPDVGAGAEVKLLSTVQVRSGWVDRILFVDANADGRQDLLLQGSGALEFQAKYLAYGVGDGTFHSQPAVPTKGGDGQAARALLEVTSTILAEAPGNAGGYFTAEPTVAGASYYLSATALDVTGDELKDVVAVTFGHLDVFRGHPTGVPSMVSITSQGWGRLRDVGDFDGDGRPDVLVNNARQFSERPSVLSVLFAPFEATSSLSELAEFANTTQALVGYLKDEAGSADPYADVAAIHGRDGALQLSFLEGGADRQLRFPLSRQTLDGASPLHFPAFGRFRGDAEIALLSVPLEGGAARIELTSVTRGEPGLPEPLDLELELWMDPNLDFVAAFDTDGDNRDELYVMAAEPETPEDHGLFRIDLNESPAVATRVAIPGVQGLVGFTGQDIDGDGTLDLTVMDAGQSLEDSAVYARLWGTDEWKRLKWPAEQCTTFGGYAFIQADSDVPLELALSCAFPLLGNGGTDLEPSETPSFIGTLVVYDVDLSTNKLRPLHAETQTGPVALRLGVGDFNGDGVQDLMSGLGEISLLLGEPRP